MDKNFTYNPEDIEELLMNKSFDELLFEEKEFVLNHVESEQEYKELRNTLLSIKKYSDEQDQLVVPHRIKSELMKLMEQKQRPFGWFNLNSFGAFLFPSGVSFYRKPGIQFASLSLMLLFVINIGLDRIENQSGKLAINTIKEERSILPKDEVTIPVAPLEEKKETLDLEEPESIPPKVSPALVEVLDDKEEKSIDMDLQLEEAEEITYPKNGSYQDLYQVKQDTTIQIANQLKDVEVTAPKLEADEVIPTFSNNSDFKKIDTRTNNANAVTLSEVQVTKAKRIKMKLPSQTLESSEEVIDLLFVSM